MGLTRSSSGLLLYDDFSSNTEANYIISGDDGSGWAVTGGAFVGTPAGDSFARRAYTTCKCVTARVKQTTVSGWCKFVGLGGSNTLYYDVFPYGYWIESNNSTTALNLIYCHSGGTDLIDSWATSARSNDTYYLWRLYLSGNTVYGKFGGAALADLDSCAHSTYTQGTAYLGCEGSSAWDWFEARTAHTITCSGMTDGHYLRVTDGTTAAEAAASGGTATVDAGIVTFPLTSAAIYTAASGGGSKLAEITSGTLADMGGGDAFAYAADSAAVKHNLMLMGVG